MQVNNHVTSNYNDSYRKSRSVTPSARAAFPIALTAAQTTTPLDSLDSAAQTRKSDQQIIQQRMQEILEKLERGDTEPSYQIGAQTLTEKEWNRLLESFDTTADLLTTESTSCTMTDEDGNSVHYITWYNQDGIYCRKAGQTDGYAWTIPLETQTQYEKVLAFLKELPADKDLSFTAQENFWKEFLTEKAI